jgi:hypothetical protein
MSRIAPMIGIPRNTLQDWLTKGKDPRNRKHYRFRTRLFKIKAEREKRALEIIGRCGQGDFVKTDTVVKKNAKGEIEVTKRTTQMYPQWQAEAWFLERRHKKDYSREMTADDKTPEEHARQIQEAYNAVMASVPTDVEDNPHNL